MGLFGSKNLKIKDKFSLGSLPGGVALLDMARNVIVSTAEDDKNIRIWDVQERAELKQIKGNKKKITALAISPDEAILATASNKTVQLWDLKDLKATKCITEKNKIHSLAFHPDGGRIAQGKANATISIKDLTTDKTESSLKPSSKIIKALFEESPKEITEVSFSPDGSFIAGVEADGFVILWKLKKGKTANIFSTPPHQYFSVTFSPDSRYMLAAGGHFDFEVSFTPGGAAEVQVNDLGGTLIVYDLIAENSIKVSTEKFICERASVSSDGGKIVVLTSSPPLNYGLKKTVNAYSMEDVLTEKPGILDKSKAKLVLGMGKGAAACSAVFGSEGDTLAVSQIKGLQFFRLGVLF